MADDTIESVAFSASLRALDKQERVLEELRSRTGLLLAASSLAASFLGGRVSTDADRDLVLASLVAFIVSIGACVFVLVPRAAFTFTLSGSGVYEELYRFKDDIREIQRRLVYDLDRFWEANDAAMQPLVRAFRVAAFALSFEVVLLLAALGDTL